MARNIACILFVVLLSQSPQALADTEFTWFYSAVNDKTKAAIEGVTVTAKFTDKTSEKQTTQTCVTDAQGKCKLSLMVKTGFWSGGSVDSIAVPSIAGYAKRMKSSSISIDATSMRVNFFLEKSSEGRYTIGYYDDLIDEKDDDLEVRATLSTLPAHKAKAESMDEVRFLRAFVDKKTGTPTFQVYVSMSYRAEGFRRYNASAISSPNGPLDALITNIDLQVDCGGKSAHNAFCDYKETVGIAIDEAMFRRIAEVFRPDVESEWKFRLKSQSGTDSTLSLPYAEIAAFLARVDRYASQIRK